MPGAKIVGSLSAFGLSPSGITATQFASSGEGKRS
jgi:hypothetical protein